MFYALRDTWSPTIATIISTITNLIFNIIGMYLFGSFGIAASTSFSGFILTITCLIYLWKKHKINFNWGNYLLFLSKYIIQLAIGIALFLSIHTGLCMILYNTQWYSFFCVRWGYWLFTIPLFLFTMVFMFYSKEFYKIKLYFLNK